MAAEEVDFSCRIIGTRGEAFAPNFVLPHQDDRVLIKTKEDTWVEQLGRKTSYTYQLEAFAAHLRDGAALPINADDAVATMELIDASYRAAGLQPRPATQPSAGTPPN